MSESMFVRDPERKRALWKARRARLRAAGLCINGAGHGPATSGVLCEQCRIVHRSWKPGPLL